MAALRKSRLPFLALGILSLLCGLTLGLVRIGWALPLPATEDVGAHGPLMVCGFLGTVIALERAVALGRRWGFLAPLLTAAGVVFLSVPPLARLAPVPMTLAGAALLAVYGVMARRQASLFLAVMAAGAACWLVGNALWLSGFPIFRLVTWWVAFPVLTIAGERLELTRYLPPARAARASFVAVAVALVTGAVLASFSPERPPRLVGLALLALAAWLVRHDVARRTLRQGGLARFAALCLLSGYAWLGLGGLLAAAAPGEFSGPAYDATLHAVFVGFVFSMIFAHAPIIFPAVLGGRALFRRAFYAHLVLLHASLVLRVAGDLSLLVSDGSWGRARAWGGALSAAAVVLFLLNTVRSLRFGAEPRAAAAAAGGSPLDFLPARWVPLLYFAFAHASLATAMGVTAADPLAVTGFYYHPRLVAVVHMVTLGWISGSILGALYLVAPLAFRTALPATWRDYAAFGAFALGTVGMVGHFWIGELVGVAWAAGFVLAALAFVGVRVLRGLRRAPVPASARLPVALAIVNVLAAGAFGMLLAVNKTRPFLPASQLEAVLGHAHLAVIGWAVTMVMGAGYRLLPMILPAAMPRGAWPFAGTLLTTAGAWGIFGAFLAGGRLVAPFALAAAAGIAVFLSRVAWMARNRKPAPPERPRPDPSLLHNVQALAYAGASVVVGLGLVLAPATESSLRWAMAYGVFALVGFLAQMVVGVAGRLVPLYAWLWGFADRGHKESPPSLHRAPAPALPWAVLVLWTAGVPALAAGLALDRPALVRSGAGALGAAVLLGGAHLGLTLLRLWRRPAAAGQPDGSTPGVVELAEA